MHEHKKPARAAGGAMGEITVLSSFVPLHNPSPVGVNYKMLRMCCDAFGHTTFITGNYPPAALEGLPPGRCTLVNVPLAIGKSTLAHMAAHLAMQLRVPGAIKKATPKGGTVLFWLTGPMLLPFLYCKWKGYKTIAFLYGNSRLKSGRINPLNSFVAAVTGFIGTRANVTCVEATAVAAHWKLDFAAGHMRRVHLYVDTDRFAPFVPYEARPQTVGMCCRLVPSKKPLECIRAFHALRHKYPHWRLEIAGTGLLRRQCDKLIAQLCAQERISMLSWVENNDMPEVYNRWRLLLHPTNYEGLPSALLESMACGTPALATPVGGIADVLRNGENGWVLGEDLAEALDARLAGGLPAEVSRRAVADVQAEYNYQSSLQNLKEQMARGV